MRNVAAGVAAMRRKNITVKADYRLTNCSTQVMIFGTSYKTWREQMGEFEDYGRRADLTLVARTSPLSASYSTASSGGTTTVTRRSWASGPRT